VTGRARTGERYNGEPLRMRNRVRSGGQAADDDADVDKEERVDDGAATAAAATFASRPLLPPPLSTTLLSVSVRVSAPSRIDANEKSVIFNDPSGWSKRFSQRRLP